MRTYDCVSCKVIAVVPHFVVAVDTFGMKQTGRTAAAILVTRLVKDIGETGAKMLQHLMCFKWLLQEDIAKQVSDLSVRKGIKVAAEGGEKAAQLVGLKALFKKQIPSK